MTTPRTRIGNWKYIPLVLMLRPGWRCCQLPPGKELLISIGYINADGLLYINIFFHCFL
jgi:hypothetical protein